VSGKNLFQGVAFCRYCGGPIGRQRPNPKGRADHPGYVRCSRAARGLKDADGEPCAGGSTSVLLDEWEAHCLTRLQRAVWVELLRRPDDEEQIAQLRQQHHDLAQAADRDANRLTQLEERAEETWASGADEELIATANRATAKARDKAAASRAAAAEVEQELAALLALPQADQLAAEIDEQIRSFMQQLPSADADDRMRFNRWLVSRRPAIRFELDVAQNLVGLAVGDGEPDWQPLAAVARRRALADGIVNPAGARDQPGIGATVLTRDGEMVLEPMPGELDESKDWEQIGYDQAMEDLRRLSSQAE
jgi:hypothetical protein